MKQYPLIHNLSDKSVVRPWRIGWLGALITLVSLAVPVSAVQVRVRDGQMVRLKLHSILTTENVEKNDWIDFDVAEDVVLNNHIVIAKGAVARGKVVNIKGAGKKKAKDAEVTFRFISVRSVDNQEIPLRVLSYRSKKKQDAKDNEVEESSPIPGYAERLIGAEKGKEYAVYTDAATIVNASDAPPVAAASAPAPAQPVQAAPQAPSQAVAEAPAASQPAPATPGADAVSVEFNTNPAGADIVIDSNFVGNTPSTLRLAPGRHVIELRLGGYRAWTRTMMIEPGSHPTVRATLGKQ